VNVSADGERPVTPRWEWRTFGETFEGAEDILGAMTPEAVQETDELYIVAAGTPAIVKVRFELMDVKRLLEVDDNGLQLWVPVMKSGFPLAAEHLADVFRELGATAPDLAGEEYTLDQVIAEIVGTGGRLRAVSVHKKRARYTVNGCMAELTDVTADGKPTRTIAVEAADPAAVIAAVESLGLGGRPNQSYASALSDLTAEASPVAVIDVGTNSVKFLVAERATTGEWRRIVDRAEVTRLGEGLEQSGAMTDQAVERTATAIVGMVDEARSHGVTEFAAVGTAGLRMASNRADLVDEVTARTGVEIEVISGDEETRLAYLATAAALGLGEGSLVVVDTGGGSTQFTFGHAGEIDERFSVDVGAVRYTDRFRLDQQVDPDGLAEALAAISDDLSRIDDRPSPEMLVGMGGAITNMTAVELGLAVYDPDRVHGAVLSRDSLDRQIERYRSVDAEGRRSIVGLQPSRAEVILAGACIVRTVMAKLGKDSLTVSDRGLRHGVLVERFGA
jgi:exopolyphosphatase/guanosine-5'-triphosphate,3'-diphosphate pyrophosphatase